MFLGHADDDVGGHGVAEDGDTAVAQAFGEGRDLRGLVCQGCCGAADFGDAAGQGARVAAVATEIERDGDVAGASEGDGEGLHQLLGAGEAVRDDDDRGWAGRI